MAWNKNNQNGNKGTGNYNLVENWGLYCHEYKEITGKDGNSLGVSLRCSLNGKKREDGSYPKSMNISVNCYSDSCTETPSDDPTNKKISVNGYFYLGEYTNKDGVAVPTYNINASSVKLS